MQLKEWNQPLWRVDNRPGSKGQTLRNIYPNDRPTYFLIDPSASASYIKHYVRKNTSGRRKLIYYVKQFVPSEPLQLLDMGQIETVEEVLRSVNSNSSARAIRTSFEIRDGRVHRVSENNSKHLDDVSLRAICRFCESHGLDGYYVDAPGLHPEIGLCSSSFSKLDFIDQNVKEEAATFNISRKRPRPNNFYKRRRTNNNRKERSNNNNNNNNNGILPPPPKMPRFSNTP